MCCVFGQLRTVYSRLESDLQSSKKRHVELVEQCNELKKGREESVSCSKLYLFQKIEPYFLYCRNGFVLLSWI